MRRSKLNGARPAPGRWRRRAARKEQEGAHLKSDHVLMHQIAQLSFDQKILLHTLKLRQFTAYLKELTLKIQHRKAIDQHPMVLLGNAITGAADQRRRIARGRQADLLLAIAKYGHLSAGAVAERPEIVRLFPDKTKTALKRDIQRARKGRQVPSIEDIEATPTRESPEARQKMHDQLQFLLDVQEDLVDTLIENGFSIEHRADVVARRSSETATERRERSEGYRQRLKEFLASRPELRKELRKKSGQVR